MKSVHALAKANGCTKYKHDLLNIVDCRVVTRVGPKHHPNDKVLGANMGPTWGQQDPGGPHVGPMNLAIWAVY